MIEWMEASKRNKIADGCDVSVRVISKGGGRENTHITFYDGSYRKITNGNSIKIGTSADKIYFGESRNGFKLRDYNKNPECRKVVIAPRLEDFVGDYKLQYDAYEKCYCIAKGNKKVD